MEDTASNFTSYKLNNFWWRYMYE